MQFYKIKFGYSQVLFLGSVPRINCHLAIVPLFIFNKWLKTNPLTRTVQYDKRSKGVSILSYQLPYTLKLVPSYPITSNSKAAKGLLVHLEVNCICTVIPISLSQSLRQLLYRYIIHARPHLTARVFRYLRTLKVRPPLIGVFLQSLAYFSQLSKSDTQPI